MFKSFKLQVQLDGLGGISTISPDYLSLGVGEVNQDHSDMQGLCSWSTTDWLQESLEKI